MKAAVILSRAFNRAVNADLIICADGGYDIALSHNLRPDVVIGDMDSAVDIASDVKVIRYDREKDYTDGELGVRYAAECGANEADIFGADGGRIDHVLYNMHLLAIADSLGVKAVLRGDHYDGYFCRRAITVEVDVGDTVSIVPFSEEVHIIKAKGLKYPADGVVINKENTLGISNVATEKSIYFETFGGTALVFRIF